MSLKIPVNRKVIKEVIKSNQIVKAVYFLLKILSHIILNPPTYHFQLNFSKKIFLEIFIRFDSDFKNYCTSF